MIGRFCAIEAPARYAHLALESPRARPHRQTVATELSDPDNELWLSPVSTWEALILHEKGKIRLEEDIERWIADATAPFRQAHMSHEIALASRRLPLRHRGPADRFLAATAKVLGLTLVTADTNLLGLGEIATLANR